MSKERTIDELRQVKTYGYSTPKVVNEYYRKVNFDPQYIVDLIREYPNNQDLGKEIRKYYNSLKLIPMTRYEFNKQTAGFMKFQSLIFNLLFNYNIKEIQETLG